MDPVLSQALATLITTVATVLLLWATSRFKSRDHEGDDNE